MEGAIFQLEANRDIYNFDQEVIVPTRTILEIASSDEKREVKFKIDLPTDLTNPYKPMPIDNVEIHGDPNSLFLVREIKAPQGYQRNVPNNFYGINQLVSVGIIPYKL